MEDLGEPGAEERLRSKGCDDIEEVYNGSSEILLLATRRGLTKKRKESSEIRCWCGFGVLLLQGRLDCSQDNGCLEKYKLVVHTNLREKDRARIGAELTCCWLCRFGDRILSSFSARLGADIVILGRKTEDGLMLRTLNVAPRDSSPRKFLAVGPYQR